MKALEFLIFAFSLGIACAITNVIAGYYDLSLYPTLWLVAIVFFSIWLPFAVWFVKYIHIKINASKHGLGKDAKYSKQNIKVARSLALNITLLGGPNLNRLDDFQIVDRMLLLAAGLSVVGKSGFSVHTAEHAFRLLGEAMKKSD